MNRSQALVHSVGILGTGRLAHALQRSLAQAGIAVILRSARDPECVAALRADLAVIAVSDDAIGQVADRLAETVHTGGGRGVVHCSGALDRTPLAALADQGWATGGWHPMQAFATTESSVVPGVTWGITADEGLAGLLADLTRALGGHPLRLRDEDRARYHAAAAMASNYTDVLVFHAARLLEDCGTDRDTALRALLPLVRTSLDGLEAAGLPDGLTGPAARGDIGTLRRHLVALADRPDTHRLYREAGLATIPLLRERGMDAATLDAIDSALRNQEVGSGHSGT